MDKLRAQSRLSVKKNVIIAGSPNEQHKTCSKSQKPLSISPPDLKTEQVIVKIERHEGSIGTCRVCLVDGGDIPIHGNDSFSDVSQELNTFAGINVRENDEFPKYLCHNCNSLLQGAIQLRTTAQYSEIKLLQQIIHRSDVEDSGDQESWQETDSTAPGCPEAVCKPSTIKNMFNLKVINNVTDNKHKSDACWLKIEPLVINKSVRIKKPSNIDKYSFVKKPPAIMNIKPADTQHIIKFETSKTLEPITSDEQIPLINFAKMLQKPIDNKNTSNMEPEAVMSYNEMRTAVVNKSVTKPSLIDKNCSKETPPAIMNIKTSDTPLIIRYDTTLDKQIPIIIKNASDTEQETGLHSDEKRIAERKPQVNRSKYDLTSARQYCKRCKISFENKQEYLKHIKLDEHINFKITCPVCNKKVLLRTFSSHKALHDKVIKHICDICGKGLCTSSSLTSHRARHFLVLPFHCSQCPYRCRDNYSLKLHMRTHTGEKPYQCSECADRFATISNLYRHTLTNHKASQFTCDQCSRQFHRKIDLEKHIKERHMGIKDFACDICGKAFGNRKIRLKHLKQVHKKKKCNYNRLPLYLLPEYQNTLESEGSGKKLGETTEKVKDQKTSD